MATWRPALTQRVSATSHCLIRCGPNCEKREPIGVQSVERSPQRNILGLPEELSTEEPSHRWRAENALQEGTTRPPLASQRSSGIETERGRTPSRPAARHIVSRFRRSSVKARSLMNVLKLCQQRWRRKRDTQIGARCPRDRSGRGPSAPVFTSRLPGSVGVEPNGQTGRCVRNPDENRRKPVGIGGGHDYPKGLRSPPCQTIL